MTFVLRYDDPGPNEGTYFIGFKGPSFLPVFGPLEDAYRFSTRSAAASDMGRHYVMGSCEVVDFLEAVTGHARPNTRSSARSAREKE